MVASNRGPISVTAVDDGEDEVDRSGGGLVSGMLAALKDRDDVVWLCAALNAAERALAREADHGHVSGSHSSVGLLRSPRTDTGSSSREGTAISSRANPLSHSRLVERRPVLARQMRTTRLCVGSRCESDEPDT